MAGTGLKRAAAFWLAGTAVLLAGCAPGQAFGPPPSPTPKAEITQTADATYMHNVGGPVKRVVPDGPTIDQTTSDRLTALEHRMDGMQHQLDSMMPALTRLAGTQGDPQAMLGHLNAADRAAPDAAMPAGVAAPSPPAVVTDAGASDAPQSLITQTPAAVPHAAHHAHAAALSGTVVQSVRIGEHPGATRIVFDVSAKTPFHSDLDNDEHILTVQVPGAGWADGTGEHKTPRSPLLSSWQAAPDGQGGTRFALQLRKAAKINHSETLPAGGGQPARLVIDLAAE